MNVVRRGCKQPLVAPHLVRLPFRMHVAMLTTPPPSFDQRETGKVAAVKDQSQSGSCEGHACSGATETRFALAGNPLGYIPSEDGLYKGARAVDRARFAGATLPALTDGGTNTDDVLSFMSTFGIRARRIAQSSDGRNSDVELATVNAEPELGDLEAGAVGDRLIVGPYAIDPTASDAEQQVQAAIAALIPVRVDAFVDMVFEDWTPSKAPVPTPNTADSRGGGHAIYIVGYAPGFYVVRNSWGTSWGDAGDVRVSPEWLRASWGLFPWTCRKVAA